MKPAGRWLLIVLLCFHMTAVAAMTIPSPSVSAFSQWIRGNVRPWTDPYVNMTSQWQSWDLFAPNPNNWITEERIEMQTADGWEQVERIAGDTLPAWHQADAFKIQQQMESENGMELRLRFLNDLCLRHGYPSGTLVRIVLLSRVLQRDSDPVTLGPWNEYQTAISSCPDAP